MIKAPGFPGYFSDNGMVLWFQDVPGIAWISMSEIPRKEKDEKKDTDEKEKKAPFFLSKRPWTWSFVEGINNWFRTLRVSKNSGESMYAIWLETVGKINHYPHWKPKMTLENHHVLIGDTSSLYMGCFFPARHVGFWGVKFLLIL